MPQAADKNRKSPLGHFSMPLQRFPWQSSFNLLGDHIPDKSGLPPGGTGRSGNRGGTLGTGRLQHKTKKGVTK